MPLDEAEERYRLEILDGSAVVRTVEIGEAEFAYAAADELADFGMPQTDLACARQLGGLPPVCR